MRQGGSGNSTLISDNSHLPRYACRLARSASPIRDHGKFCFRPELIIFQQQALWSGRGQVGYDCLVNFDENAWSGQCDSAIKRQKENPGTQYAGAVLQHLVGAKLSLVLPEGCFAHHGFSVSDAMSARSGDFVIDDVVIHTTTAPGEALMRKCAANLSAGCRPIIVTVHANMPAAESLADIQGIAGRVDVLEVEQFIATNVYELSLFKTADRKLTIEKLVDRYNAVVADCETDPSLKITLG